MWRKVFDMQCTPPCASSAPGILANSVANRQSLELRNKLTHRSTTSRARLPSVGIASKVLYSCHVVALKSECRVGHCLVESRFQFVRFFDNNDVARRDRQWASLLHLLCTEQPTKTGESLTAIATDTRSNVCELKCLPGSSLKRERKKNQVHLPAVAFGT